MILILHFNQFPAETVDALCLDNGTVAEKHCEPLDAIASLAGEKEFDEVRFVIPGELVTSLSVNLPRGSNKQIAQALPYIVEEQLASPIGDIHLVRGEISPDRQCPVLAIERRVMTELLEVANRIPAPLTAILPDFLGLSPESHIQLVEVDHRRLIRFPDGGGLVAATETNLDNILNEEPQLVPRAQFEKGLSKLPPEISLNLLQGDFQLLGSHKGRWRIPVVVSLAASLAILVGYFLLAGWYFGHHADLRHKEAVALYQSLFPDDKRILNIRNQMQGHLLNTEKNGGQDAFFRLLSGLSASIDQLPERSLTPRYLQYDNADTRLIAEIQASAVADSTNLRQAMAEHRLIADILSVTKNDAGVLTRLEVTLQ